MGYLILNDYLRVIQTTELNAITSNTDSLRQLVETSVQAEINSELIERFDTASEFSNLSPFDPTFIYSANQRVYLTAPVYVPANAYVTNQQTLYNGQVYISKAGNSAEAFTIGHWTLLGNQYDIFFMKLPYPLFSVDADYFKNDGSFWKGNVYVNQSGSTGVDEQTALESPSIESINYGNVIPDDRTLGVQAWGKPIAFTLIAGLLPTNPLAVAYSGITPYAPGTVISYNAVNYICVTSNGGTNPVIAPGTNPLYWLPVMWTLGDNRNQQLVELFMDIVVYKLCKRIAPNNIPEARHNAWIKAFKDIEKFANGKVNAQIAILQPKQGNRIQAGGWPQQDFSGGF